jgi:hypothetical protein
VQQYRGFLQAMGIPIWQPRARASKNVHIFPYLLASKCVVLLPLNTHNNNNMTTKIKMFMNKMLQVLALSVEQLVIISIYMDSIDALLGEVEQKIILDYLEQNKTMLVLSFLATQANTELTMQNIALAEIAHPEIIMQQSTDKADIYKKLLDLKERQLFN